MTRKFLMVKILAYFWRYGWIALMWLNVFLLRKFIDPTLIFGFHTVAFGIYTVVIASLLCEHFICGMQNAYHQKMTPHNPHYKIGLEKYRKEGIFIGILFFVMGTFLIIIRLC